MIPFCNHASDMQTLLLCSRLKCLIQTSGPASSRRLELNVIFMTTVRRIFLVSMFSTDVVLTSKHHEGWCNFRGSYHWNWNSVDAGPKRDLVGNLTASVRAAGLHMGLYHSLREWFNPLYLEDNANNCTDPKFPDEVLLPTLREIVNQYKVHM